MKKNMLSRILAIGVIISFISIGFQPAFALENTLATVNLEKKEDFDSPEIDRFHPIIVKFLFTNLKFFTKNILSRFGHFAEVKENSQEILDIIDSNRPRNNQFFCNFLEELSQRYELLYLKIEHFQDNLKETSLFVGGFICAIIEIYQAFIYYFRELLDLVGYHVCNWPWPVW